MLLALSALFIALPAFANDFMGELMAPPGMKIGNTAKAELRHYGAAEANHESFRVQQSRLEISSPFAGEEGRGWRAKAFAEYDDIRTRAAFPNGRPVPNRLWDTGIGLSHHRALNADRLAGGNLTVSSASDRPFGAGRDLGFSLNLSYKVPAENEAAWLFFLSMSNTRGFLNYVPLPGFAYSFRAHARVRMVVGIPFALVFWRPADAWTVSFMYFPVRTAELRLSYGSPRGPQPFALASFKTRNFRLYGRSDKEERLFVDEGLFQAGISSPLSRNLAVELSGGLAFARRYFLAKKVTEHASSPLVKAENAPFGQLQLRAFF